MTSEIEVKMRSDKARMKDMAKFANPPQEDEPLFVSDEECVDIMKRGIPLHYAYRLAHDILVMKTKTKGVIKWKYLK